MSKKPSELKPTAAAADRPVARPAEPKPRRLSAKERRSAAQPSMPAPLPKSEPAGEIVEALTPTREVDSPKVAAAKRVLDRMSESLGPEAAPAGTLIRCAFHDRMEDPSLFSKNSAHKNGYASSCKAGLKMRAAEWAKKGTAK